MKQCTSCKITKELSEFNKRKTAKDGLSYLCKGCSRKSSKQSYELKSKQYVQRNVDRIQYRLSRFTKWKEQQCCIACSETDTVCLDFHHVNTEEKEYEIADLARHNSIDRVADELNKCVCLCSNCHRKAHAYGIEYRIVKLLGDSYIEFNRGMV